MNSVFRKNELRFSYLGLKNKDENKRDRNNKFLINILL